MNFEQLKKKALITFFGELNNDIIDIIELYSFYYKISENIEIKKLHEKLNEKSKENFEIFIQELFEIIKKIAKEKNISFKKFLMKNNLKVDFSYVDEYILDNEDDKIFNF